MYCDTDWLVESTKFKIITVTLFVRFLMMWIKSFWILRKLSAGIIIMYCTCIIMYLCVIDVMIFLLWWLHLLMKLVYLWERNTRKYYHLTCSLFVFIIDNNRYNVFPPLDPTLFLSPVSPTNSPYDKSPSVNRATSQSAISFL